MPSSDSSRSRPLNGFARTALVVTTATTIALFYLFISLMLVLLAAWIGVVLIVALALARFGAMGLVSGFLERDIRLMSLLARSLWLRPSPAFRLALAPADAPRLFALVGHLAQRLAIRPPDELCLEMNAGAWVELRGLKSGLGTTRVGVGYDLLAALSEREVEAVMAHELAHAKLIGRALHNWLSKGLRRAATVSNSLAATADGFRRAEKSFGIGELILRGADALTRLCARQMGAYSRQGEFEADHLAAQLCGAAPVRSSLLRLEAVHEKLSQLPWNERLAQIESPVGLSQWLLRELDGATPVTATAAAGEIFDRYSTHPPLHDRLAALPEDRSPQPASPRGLTLLAQPDQLALKLADAIEATALQEERKDRKQLKSWLRSIRKSSSIRAAQLPGVLLVLIGLITGIVALITEFWFTGAILLAGVTPLGFWLTRFGYYKDKRALAVPNFELFMRARHDFPLPNIEEKQKQIEEEFRSVTASEQKARKKSARLIDEAYTALARGDYLRAHTASRLAAEFDKKSIERALAMMVGAAAFNQTDLFGELLRAILKQTSLRSPSSAWAAAWALMLTQDWMPAEALLGEAMKSRDDNADLRAMLALCQSRRGKLQSALENIRAACTPRAPTNEHLKLLVSLLLDRGALREATARLAEFGPASAYDPEVVHLRVRLHLLRREFEHVDAQLALLNIEQEPGHRLLTVALLYEQARAEIKTEEFLEKTLARGHFPAARLAQARLATKNQNHARAREHIYAALDTTKTPGEKSASAGELFHAALQHLMGLEELSATCRAWIVKLPSSREPGTLSLRSLVVYAPDQAAVVGYVHGILRAMRPDLPPPTSAHLPIHAAPRDMQPDRPVRPGVQYVYQ